MAGAYTLPGRNKPLRDRMKENKGCVQKKEIQVYHFKQKTETYS